MGSNNLSAKRKSMQEQSEQELYEELLDTLAAAKQLDAVGNRAESGKIVSAMFQKLQDNLDNLMKDKEQNTSRVINRKGIPETAEVLAENDIVVLRMLAEKERDSYINLSYECSVMKSMFKDETFKEDLWSEFTNERAIVASIYDKQTGNFVGYCSVKDMRKDDWEIAIEEKEIFRNKGYGFNALRLFISTVAGITGQRFFRARIDIDNFASQKVWKKLGGYPNGISEFMLHGEDLEAFQSENMNCIDDQIRSVAEEFCMEPEEMLGYVLEYRLDATNPS